MHQSAFDSLVAVTEHERNDPRDEYDLESGNESPVRRVNRRLWYRIRGHISPISVSENYGNFLFQAEIPLDMMTPDTRIDHVVMKHVASFQVNDEDQNNVVTGQKFSVNAWRITKQSIVATNMGICTIQATAFMGDDAYCMHMWIRQNREIVVSAMIRIHSEMHELDPIRVHMGTLPIVTSPRIRLNN